MGKPYRPRLTDLPARPRSLRRVLGIDAYLVRVEADVASGMPTFTSVGMPQGAVTCHGKALTGRRAPVDEGGGACSGRTARSRERGRRVRFPEDPPGRQHRELGSRGAGGARARLHPHRPRARRRGDRTCAGARNRLDGYVEAAASPAVRARLAAGENVPLGEIVASVTPERVRELARLTAEAGAWPVPTPNLRGNLRGAPDPDALVAKPEMRYGSAPQRQQWHASVANRPAVPTDVAAAHNRLRLDILRANHEAGGGILMGTDSPQLFNVPGFALYREIERMEAAGLSRSVILESGTREVARYMEESLGLEGNFGTVAVGNRADLILLDANPLESLGNLERLGGVMVRGQWLPGEEIRERLARIEARHADG